MKTETASEYTDRCFAALGQSAQNEVLVAEWCYDHPPRKPLPKPKGTREWNVFIERRIGQCLKSVAGDEGVAGMANAILRQWIQDNLPDVYAMFERHEQEVEARVAELRRNEPELQTQENA